ncbi:hypothetical protein Pfo_021286 [Paulownia fortunei]|nr:hypothetical protein Pfo_021286 [Paulownia fortunei]
MLNPLLQTTQCEALSSLKSSSSALPLPLSLYSSSCSQGQHTLTPRWPLSSFSRLPYLTRHHRLPPLPGRAQSCHQKSPILKFLPTKTVANSY